MTYCDGRDREMSKWSYHRLATARQEAEEAQRLALTELDVGLTATCRQRAHENLASSSASSSKPSLTGVLT
ncbi:hypothetical protein ACGFK1_28260 [Mycobacterium sp. NPDC048908]|uniref:hypothetical protein n=1 Tax=Mycobacterium sp. NPDC048908 TaxID=3364292 RepID=UPI003712EC1B